MNETPSERAGGSGTGAWAWRGDELFDVHGAIIADVRAEVLRVGQHRLLLEHTSDRMTFRLRGTAVDGTIYLLEQSGFTVAHLAGDCRGRRYAVTRLRPWRKERVITDLRSGDRVVRLRPRLDGSLQVEDGPDMDHFELLDVVFLTYGCTLVDLPGRNLRI